MEKHLLILLYKNLANYQTKGNKIMKSWFSAIIVIFLLFSNVSCTALSVADAVLNIVQHWDDDKKKVEEIPGPKHWDPGK